MKMLCIYKYIHCDIVSVRISLQHGLFISREELNHSVIFMLPQNTDIQQDLENKDFICLPLTLFTAFVNSLTQCRYKYNKLPSVFVIGLSSSHNSTDPKYKRSSKKSS